MPLCCYPHPLVLLSPCPCATIPIPFCCHLHPLVPLSPSPCVAIPVPLCSYPHPLVLLWPCGCNIVNVIQCHSMSQCHSLSSLTVTELCCLLQLPSLSLSLQRQKGPATTQCTQCTNTKNHKKFECEQTQSQQIGTTARHRRHSTGDNLFDHDIFRGCAFSLWPFMFFVTSHKKCPPPPPGPGPPKWRQN